MASKYTRSKRGRSPSRYPDRLAARGLSKAPVMPSVEYLREKHRREAVAALRAVGVTHPFSNG